MAALKGPIICPLPIHTPLKKRAGHLQGGFWVCRPQSKSLIGASVFLYKSRLRNNWPLYSSINSPSGDSGSIAGNYRESDEDYVDCTVIEAGNFIFTFSFLFTFEDFCFVFLFANVSVGCYLQITCKCVHICFKPNV